MSNGPDRPVISYCIGCIGMKHFGSRKLLLDVQSLDEVRRVFTNKQLSS